jgi:hypothetical protein
MVSVNDARKYVRAALLLAEDPAIRELLRRTLLALETDGESVARQRARERQRRHRKGGGVFDPNPPIDRVMGACDIANVTPGSNGVTDPRDIANVTVPAGLSLPSDLEGLTEKKKNLRDLRNLDLLGSGDLGGSKGGKNAPVTGAMSQASGARGTRIPPSTASNEEVHAFLKRWGIDGTDPQWPEFLDYWRGIPGKYGVKLDWAAVWRNNARRRDGANGTTHRARPGVQPAAPPGERLWKSGKEIR